MPLKWQRGVNPYVFNYFGTLRCGPNSTALQIQARARDLARQVAARGGVELAGQPLNEFAISEAAKKLLEPDVQAEELLLVHPHRPAERGNLDALVGKLAQTATLPDQRETPALVHPTAVFWFLPAPDGEAAALPEFETLGLVAAGDEPDVQLDIVFDE
jgi:hypothetical protein